MQRNALWLVAAAAALCAAGPAGAHSDASGFAGDDHHHHEPTRAERPALYPATVRVDPRGIENLVLKVNARIVNLRELYPGHHVERGEVLAEFESAELETLQRSYIETYANMQTLRGITITGDEKLIEGRMNLQWRGLSEEGMQYVEDMRQPLRQVPIHSPVDGFVLESRVVDGQIINAGAGTGLFSLAGATLFRIADYEAITIEAALPIAAAAQLEPGAPVTFWASANGEGRVRLRGWVDQVAGNVDPLTQRRLVRMKPVPGPEAARLRNGTMLRVALGEMEDQTVGEAPQQAVGEVRHD